MTESTARRSRTERREANARWQEDVAFVREYELGIRETSDMDRAIRDGRLRRRRTPEAAGRGTGER